MCDNVNTTQNAQLGSHDNKFIGQENNYYGPSLTDVYNFVMALFRDNFPRLREEARQIAEERAKEFCQTTMKKLESTDPQKYSAFKDPDMQYVLFEAQKTYARFGTHEMLEVLTELISARVDVDSETILKVSIDKAIEIAPVLNDAQLDYLSILFLCTRTENPTIATIDELKDYLEMVADNFNQADFSAVYYLNMMGCLQLRLNDAIKNLSEAYGFSIKEVEEICPEIIKKTTGDYTTSHTGTVLAIINIQRKIGPKLKLNLKDWMN